MHTRAGSNVYLEIIIINESVEWLLGFHEFPFYIIITGAVSSENIQCVRIYSIRGIVPFVDWGERRRQGTAVVVQKRHAKTAAADHKDHPSLDTGHGRIHSKVRFDDLFLRGAFYLLQQFTEPDISRVIKYGPFYRGLKVYNCQRKLSPAHICGEIKILP